MIKNTESAVSPVMSEMLLIALVLILVPTATISMIQQIPEERVPTVTIKMTPMNSSGYVSFYHKGGDWMRKEEIKIFRNGKPTIDFGYSSRNATPIFDLGDSITIKNVGVGDHISLVAKNAVIFQGVANDER